MEVVTIEKRTFSYVCERFTEFAKRIESLCSTHTQKVENWLDSQEVCLLLGFSKRTLQYYRSSGRLAYSQIGSKIYYKSSDIEARIQTIEDEIIRELTLLGFREATNFVRTDSSVLEMQSVLGLSDEKVDELWEYALQL